MAMLAKTGKAGFLMMILLVTVLGIASAIVLFQFWLFLKVPGSVGRGINRVEIQPGTNAAAVASILQDRGIVSDAKRFYLVSRLLRVSHKLQAGEYDFVSPATPEQILDQLIHGRVVLHRLTFPEGSTVRDIARIIEQEGLASGAEIIRLSRDRNYITTLGINSSSLEGYLFPETYLFRKTENGTLILKAMVQQFWNHFPKAWQDRAGELGLGIHEIVTMASIVEKEAVVDSERSIIASVFLNRLKKNMPLESDPTAVYDLPNFSGPITAAHLKHKSPYNTYLIRGLPVGPICNPGAKSIKAVLFPEKVPYLFFVSNNDGTHQFSETLAEHNQAVLRYREARRAGLEKLNTISEAPVVGFETSSHGIGILERKERNPM